MKDLFITRPVKTNWLTQGFGQNSACAKTINGKAIRPFVIKSVTSNGTCPVGYSGFYKALGMKGHSGEDWMTWNGEPCYFPVKLKGMDWWAKNEVDRDGGIGVDIISKEKVMLWDRTDYIKFRFWHLKKSLVINKQSVAMGDIIGLCDSTGASSGHHLHWSIKRCDKNGVALDKSNGYYGAFNFRPYYENIFVLDYFRNKVKKLENQTTQQFSAFMIIIKLLSQIITSLKIQIFKAKKVGAVLIDKII